MNRMSGESIKELKRSLLACVQPAMDRHGFKLVKSKEWFVRTRPGFKDYFVLDFAEYGYLQVQPTIRLRVDQVEDIFHRTSGFEKKYQGETPTLAVMLQHLSGDPSLFEYQLHGTEQVAEVAAQLINDFEAVALSYFDTNGDLRRIDSLLNDEPDANCVHYLMEYLRCAHGLIVARLNNRQDYQALVEKYRQKMRQFSAGFYLPKLESLIADLS
jgi:hypothetical protein